MWQMAGNRGCSVGVVTSEVVEAAQSLGPFGVEFG